MPEFGKNKHKDYSAFDNMSTEMLEDILRADSQLPINEDSDNEAILYIMEVIAKREKEHPTGRFQDGHQAWESFSENYLPFIEDDKSLYDFEDDFAEEQTGIKYLPSTIPFQSHKKSILSRVVFVTAAVIALLFASTVTASAFGFNLWGAVAQWTRDTFGFSTTASISEDSEQKDSANRLQNELNQYGITTALAPTWYPDGYSLENIDVAETPARTTFIATFDNNGQEILITIVAMTDSPNRVYEKDGDDVTVYSVNQIKHYIMTNLDNINVVWATENYECSISGVLSLKDAEKMIDSIYERNSS